MAAQYAAATSETLANASIPSVLNESPVPYTAFA
jgi:hypothetical protein